MSNERQTSVRLVDITGQNKPCYPYSQPAEYCEKFTSTAQICVVFHRIHKEATTQLPVTMMVSRDRCEVVPELKSLPWVLSDAQPKHRALFEDTSLYKVIVRRDRRYHPYKRPKEYFRRHRRHNVPYYQDYRYLSSDVRKQLKMAAGNDNLAEDHVIHHVTMSTIPELEIQRPVDWSLVDWGITPLTKSDYTQMREWATESETSLTDTCSNTQSNTDNDVHDDLSTTEGSCAEQIDPNAVIIELDQREEATVDTSLNRVATATGPAVNHPESRTAVEMSTLCENEQHENKQQQQIKTDMEDDLGLLADPDEADQPDLDLSLSESSVDLLLGNTGSYDKQRAPVNDKQLATTNDKQRAPVNEDISELPGDDVAQKSHNDITDEGKANVELEQRKNTTKVEENVVGENQTAIDEDPTEPTLNVEAKAAEMDIRLQPDRPESLHNINGMNISVSVIPIVSEEKPEIQIEPLKSAEQLVQISAAQPNDTDDKDTTRSVEKGPKRVAEIENLLTDELRPIPELSLMKINGAVQKTEAATTSIILGRQRVNLDDVTSLQDDTRDDISVLTEIDSRLTDEVQLQGSAEHAGIPEITKNADNTVSTSKDTEVKSSKSRKMKHKTSHNNGSDVDCSSGATKRPRVMYINPAMMAQFEVMVDHGATQSNTTDVRINSVSTETTKKQLSTCRRVVCPNHDKILKSVSNTVLTETTPSVRDVHNTSVKVNGHTNITSEPDYSGKQRRVNISVSDAANARYKPANKFGISGATSSRHIDKADITTTTSTTRPVNVSVSEPANARYKPAYKSGVNATPGRPSNKTDIPPTPSHTRRVICLNVDKHQHGVDKNEDRDERDAMVDQRRIVNRSAGVRRVVLPNRECIPAKPDTLKSACDSTLPVKIQITKPDRKQTAAELTAWGSIPSRYICPSRDTSSAVSHQERLESRKRRFGSTLDQPITPQATASQPTTPQETTGKRKFVLKKIHF